MNIPECEECGNERKHFCYHCAGGFIHQIGTWKKIPCRICNGSGFINCTTCSEPYEDALDRELTHWYETKDLRHLKKLEEEELRAWMDDILEHMKKTEYDLK